MGPVTPRTARAYGGRVRLMARPGPAGTRTGRPQVHRVTSARRSLADDVRHRQVRYAWMMGIRTVCLVLAVLVPVTALRIVLVIGAVVLPYFAVVFANGGREPDASASSLIEHKPRKSLPKSSENTDSDPT